MSLILDRSADKGAGGAFSPPTLSAFGYSSGEFARYAGTARAALPQSRDGAAKISVGGSRGSYRPPLPAPSRTSVPTVRTQPVGVAEAIPEPEAAGDEAVLSPAIVGYVDPEAAPYSTVFETDGVEEYAPETNGDDDVSIWTDILGTAASAAIANQWPTAQAQPGFALAQAPPATTTFGDATTIVQAPVSPVAASVMAGSCSTCPPNGPRYGKICLATGEVTPLRRRRRRKLVTASDLQGLASIKAIVGGGAAMNAAVVKALR